MPPKGGTTLAAVAFPLSAPYTLNHWGQELRRCLPVIYGIFCRAHPQNIRDMSFAKGFLKMGGNRKHSFSQKLA